MSKDKRNRTTRADKQRRRAARGAKRTLDHSREPRAPHAHGGEGLVHVGPVPAGLDLSLFGGWHNIDDLDGDFDDPDDAALFAEPSPEMMDISRCPTAAVCAACGAHGPDAKLGPIIAAFPQRGGPTVACATLCHQCAGGSFLRLLTPDQLTGAFARHQSHAGRP